MSQVQTINPRSFRMDAQRLIRRLTDMHNASPGKTLIAKISEESETRRDKQNRLLWKWHGELALHIKECLGEIYDTEDIHGFVVGKLLPKRVVTVMGEPEIKRTETKKLKVKPFAEFLTAYEMWAAETYQCLFTRPDDLYWQAMMRQAA